MRRVASPAGLAWITGTASDGGISLVSTCDSSLEKDSGSEPPATCEDVQPAAPTVPSSAAPAAPAASDKSGDSEDAKAVPRVAANTHTAWCNGYFVLTDNRNFQNMKMRIHPRWTSHTHLGPMGASKTLMPSQFWDTRTEQDQVVLVLKAWMLYR